MSTSPAPPRPRLAGPDSLGQKVKNVLGIGSLGDWVFKHVCQGSALLVIVLVALILVLLAAEAWPALQKVGATILTSTAWRPNDDSFGGLTVIYGSFVTSALAMLIAVPLGVGTAAFLAEIATGWVKRTGSLLVELLAAIPSVVYGFWGVSVLVPALVQPAFGAAGSANPGGRGILSAGLILAIMIVPYIAAVSYDACQAVPRSQREGAFALGSTRWQTIWRVVLPYARPGIIGGCFLALGRAIGETMAVTMLIGNVPDRIEWLPFGQGATIPSVIATELPNALSDLHGSALIELGLLLFAVTVVMNVIARVLIWRMGQERRGPSLWARLRPRRHPAAAPEAGDAAAPPGQPGAAPPRLPAESAGARRTDRLMTAVLGLCLVATCGPLFLVLGYISWQGIGALNLEFFYQLPEPLGQPGGGLVNGLLGSAIIVSLAALMALPVGLLAAIFLAEYRTSRAVPVVRFFGELLGGVPSIVIGTFVYALVSWFIDHRWLSNPKQQFSGWAGAFALAVMMLPIVMRASEEAIKMVPQSLRNASHALGAFHWQTVVRVCVPAALPAIITAAFLAIARIAGETAPLLLTIRGDKFNMALSPNEPMNALPLSIYQFYSGTDADRQRAWAAAMVLLTFIILLNIAVRLVTGKRVVLASRAD
jgi:phosphate transport system permease protein